MGTYYYAGGRKIVLERDHNQVAVDQGAAERAGLGSTISDPDAPLTKRGVGVTLTPRSSLTKTTLDRLQQAGALQPVYTREKATIVLLPEVRVEFDDAKQQQAVFDALADEDAPKHEIVEGSSDRLVVRPTSGNGDDALQLANYIYERAHPPAATVRLMQFVPKPETPRF